MSDWRKCPTCESPTACKHHDECRDATRYNNDGVPWHAQKLCGERVTVPEFDDYMRTGVMPSRILRGHRVGAPAPGFAVTRTLAPWE